MAAVTLRGIRIESLSIDLKGDDESGKKITAQYALISSADKVLAKQSCGAGYGGMALTPSPGTMKALDAFLAAYRADVLAMLGLDDV